MLDELQELKDTSLRELEDIVDLDQLEEWRIEYLGSKGRLTQLMRGIGQLPPEERPEAGKVGNRVKNALQSAYNETTERLKREALEHALEADRVDVTLPGRLATLGRLHLSTQTLRQIYDIFAEMGFQVYRSPDVETDEYNFELLNIPKHHPARDMQDTFYIDEERLLRTHTSPGQIWAMREYYPEPIRVILPGMCYRYEQITARSEIMFHQVEGLAVGHNITMADLKGTLINFAQRMFGEDTRVRFRASYFPFTEPSAEMDVECFICDGEGCTVCKYTGWLEVLGSGMVHPQVLRNGGYDPAAYTGYAFGMGPERIAMLQHGIDDIRFFWNNDLRFLEQF
ncbi:MAG: Phenylalanine--tRNA ligase alpha subunit [Anaerolineales bacterium]|nr:Phenylalanine--tRNA ligase alpha subunit [Anaerolineales bacterium]